MSLVRWLSQLPLYNYFSTYSFNKYLLGATRNQVLMLTAEDKTNQARALLLNGKRQPLNEYNDFLFNYSSLPSKSPNSFSSNKWIYSFLESQSSAWHLAQNAPQPTARMSREKCKLVTNRINACQYNDLRNSEYTCEKITREISKIQAEIILNTYTGCNECNTPSSANTLKR